MSTRGQLMVVGTVLTVGGLGGAGLVHALSSEPERSKAPARAPQTAEDADPQAFELEELRDTLGRLGLRTSAPAAEPEQGVSLSEVLAELEQKYQVARANAEAAGESAPASDDAAPTQPSPALEVSPNLAASPAAPPLTPAPAVPTAPQPAAVSSLDSPEAATAPERVAMVQPRHDARADVGAGDVDVTQVTAPQSNQLSPIAQYQQLVLLSLMPNQGTLVSPAAVPNQAVPNQLGQGAVAVIYVPSPAQGYRAWFSVRFPTPPQNTLGPIFGPP